MKSVSFLFLAWGTLALLLAGGALYALQDEGSPDSLTAAPALTVAVRQAPPLPGDQPAPSALPEKPAKQEQEELNPRIAGAPQSSGLPAGGGTETPQEEPQLAEAAAIQSDSGAAPVPEPSQAPQTPAESKAANVAASFETAETAPLPSLDPEPPAAGFQGTRIEQRGAGVGPPWLRYAQAFPADERRPLIAVVVSRLGLAAGTTQQAIMALPRQVGLSFTPYARNLQTWVDLARADGHEVLIDLPMESEKAGEEILGPYALRSDLTRRENLERLRWVMGRAEGIVGATTILGDRFLRHAGALEPMIEDLRASGFLLVGPKAEERDPAFLAERLGLPHVRIDSSVNEGLASRLAVDSALAFAEALALERGRALVLAQPFPVSLERLIVWLDGLSERGIALAPVSELVLRQQERLIAERK